MGDMAPQLFVSVPWDTEFDMIFLVQNAAGKLNMGLEIKEFLKELLLK